MSAGKWTRMAASSVKAAIGRLRSAREYAKALDMEDDVKPFLERAHELREDLIRLAGRLETAEVRRKVATRRHGRAA